MYAYPIEELTWAIARERQEEARRTRPHTEAHPQPKESLRSSLVRWLVGDESHRLARPHGPLTRGPKYCH